MKSVSDVALAGDFSVITELRDTWVHVTDISRERMFGIRRALKVIVSSVSRVRSGSVQCYVVLLTVFRGWV